MTNSLSTDNLIVGYGNAHKNKIVLSGVTFEAVPGKITTLIGPNGSGKSTVLKTIVGQLEKISGNLSICGQSIEALQEKDIATKMSMVMTKRPRTELMTARDMVSTGRYPYTGMLGILSEKDKECVQSAMELVNATDVADEQFDSLSDGQIQRVMLARAICQEPEILILDEPTSFLDIRFKLEILRNIKKLAATKNIAVIMSLHELDFAKAVSDYIIAVNDGRVVKAGIPAEIFSGNTVQKLYGIADDEMDTETGNVRLDKIFTSKEKKVSDENVDIDLTKKDRVNKKTKVIMVQGTMSNAGKSLLVAGLCRVFAKDGYKVVPFKSQNMALNSFITKDGLEMGRAQVMQAECAGVEPSVYMNPILLKPTDDKGSQVIVNGKSIGNMRAKEYFQYKTKLIPDIMNAYNKLCENADIVVVEGAGSPAEINLKENDIVNMGLAKMLDADVLLVGDIDRGGVFAQLLGTIELLEPDEKARIKGLIINKFRGDKSILDPGITMLEERGNIKVTGVIPYMNISVEDEDSLSERFLVKEIKAFDIAVIRYPHISNFTDFDIFEQIENVSVRYVTSVRELGNPDIIMLPGSKNTIDDLRWLYDNAFDIRLKEEKEKGTAIFGICGGYQMLGESIEDPHNIEAGGAIDGLGFIPVKTVLGSEKTTSQYNGRFCKVEGTFSELSDCDIKGYEIHMGETVLSSNDALEFTSDKTGYYKENVYGSYVHGLFDISKITKIIVDAVAKKNGKDIVSGNVLDYKAYKESQYDILEASIREYMDIDYIYKLMGL